MWVCSGTCPGVLRHGCYHAFMSFMPLAFMCCCSLAGCSEQACEGAATLACKFSVLRDTCGECACLSMACEVVLYILRHREFITCSGRAHLWVFARRVHWCWRCNLVLG
eukprot:GHRQ01018722.1.p3 GENE.GHRQ01018722.1~~GHRQ01018722.1.p3  ORF type:complete len:109 (-),score=2.68 GHRQ01018722.1:206-532(-)